MTTFFGKAKTHRRVARLIRDGVGVREASWPLPPLADCRGDDIAREVVAWVRQEMGGMRRPYGIDHVALALACKDGRGRVVCSSSLGVVRPTSFYSPEGSAGVEAFLGDARRIIGDGPGEMVGALLSLGDIAFELDSRAA